MTIDQGKTDINRESLINYYYDSKMEINENNYAPPKMSVTHHPCLTSDTEQA